MNDSVEKLIKQLESDMPTLLVNLETLDDIRIELSILRMRSGHNHTQTSDPITEQHSIRMLDDLLYYTLCDLKTNYEKIANLVERLFGLIVSSPSNENKR